SSWNDGPARTAITEFVDAVTTDGPEFVPHEARVAVFDNDGTLWTEKPMPTQLHFLVKKWRELAHGDASLAARQPYVAALSGDLQWIGAALEKHYAGDDDDLKLMIAAVLGVTADRTVDDYAEEVAAFYANELHPTLQCLYHDAVYRPMVELLRYLEANAFTN